MSHSVIIEMADIMLGCDPVLDSDGSDIVVVEAATAMGTNQAKKSTRSDVFTTSATTRAIPSAPRPSLDDSTSSSLAGWREPEMRGRRQHQREGLHDFHYEGESLPLPSLHEGHGLEEDTPVQPAKATTKSASYPCLPGMLPCLPQSKQSSLAGARWRNSQEDIESNLPQGEDIKQADVDDTVMPSFRDAEFVKMTASLLTALVNFSLDVVLLSLLWALFILPGAIVATFFILLPFVLSVIALFVAARKGWGKGIIPMNSHFLLPFAPIILDAYSLILLPYLYLSSRNLKTPCKLRARRLVHEVALRDHWSCRTVIVLCSQTVPMVILKVILWGLYGFSMVTYLQGVLGASLASSVVFIACVFAFEVNFDLSSKKRKKQPQPAEEAALMRHRVRQHIITRLSYKGGQGENQSAMNGAVTKANGQIVFVAPSIPPLLQDRVAPFRPNAQINLDDLELPGLHRLQKRKLMELSVADRSRLVIANSIVASTSCASAANTTVKLISKATTDLSTVSTYPVKKPRQTLLAIPTLSALQRLTSFCLPSALTPFIECLSDSTAEREILLSLVSYEDAALQESWTSMECLLSSVLNATSTTIPSSNSPSSPQNSNPQTSSLQTAAPLPPPISFGPSCLTTLMIKGTRLSPAAVSVLSQALSDERCTFKLSTLILSEAGLSPDAFASVCDSISKNKGLKYLDLSCSKPGTSGAQALGAMLSTNHGLIEVNLSYMGLVSSSAGAVLAGAGKSTTLLKLDLSQNHIRDDAPLLEYLVPQAPPQPQPPLQPLNHPSEASNNPSSHPDTGARPGLLRHIDMSFNWIEDGAAAWLLLLLNLVPSLKQINISHNSYSATLQHTNQTPTSLSRQPSTEGNVTPKRHGTPLGSQVPHHTHSGQLQTCTAQLEEHESKSRGLSFIAHLMSYRSLYEGKDHTLLSRLEQLDTLDIRGMLLPAWFCLPGSELRPSCLVATLPKNQTPGQIPNFKGSWLAAAAMEKRSRLQRKNSGTSMSQAASVASSVHDSGEEDGSTSQAGGSRQDKSDPLSSLFSLPLLAEVGSLRRPPSRQRTIERLGSQGAWQEANTVPEEEEGEGEGEGKNTKVPDMKLLAAIMESTGGVATGGVATGGVATGGVATGGVATGGVPLSQPLTVPRARTFASANASGAQDRSSAIFRRPPSRQRTLDMISQLLSLLPPEIQLPKRWIQRLQEPGAVLDMNEKEWRKMTRGQQTCGLYLFFESQSRILVSNVCRKAREAMMKQLFLSPQITRVISDGAVFSFIAPQPQLDQGPETSNPNRSAYQKALTRAPSGVSINDGMFYTAYFDGPFVGGENPNFTETSSEHGGMQYSESNVVDFDLMAQQEISRKGLRRPPFIVYGDDTPRMSDRGNSDSDSTVYASATSNASTAAQLAIFARYGGDSPAASDSQVMKDNSPRQHTLNPMFLPSMPLPSLTAPASPSPSQPLSTYKLNIASSRKLRSHRATSSYLLTGTDRGTKGAEPGSCLISNRQVIASLNLPRLTPASPSAALVATGVTDRVIGTPGRALGLLYGPSSNMDCQSKEMNVISGDLKTPISKRASIKREAQAVLLIGSAESRPILRILPRLLEMPLLARLQSREVGEEPLVMELLLRGRVRTTHYTLLCSLILLLPLPHLPLDLGIYLLEILVHQRRC